MIQARAWPMRAMYILIAVALAMSLFITAAPAQKVSANTNNDVTSEWDKVSTPSMTGWVLAPVSEIIDYAVADGGDTAYSILYQTYTACNTTATAENPGPWYLLKSTDAAATWSDITKGVKKEIDKKELGSIGTLLQVACDPTDPDFLAVALALNDSTVHVFLSKDGGDTFKDAGEVEAGGASFSPYYVEGQVFQLAVSPAVDGERNIAIGGCANETNQVALLFRCTAIGDSATAWEDATNSATYKGWDNLNDGIASNDLSSEAVIDIKFSPNWQTDKTILVLTVTQYDYNGDGYVHYGDAYLQTGSWGPSTQGWNLKSTANIAAVLLPHDGYIWFPSLGPLTGGITLPSDYNGKKADTRLLWVWVNYAYDIPWYTSGEQACTIYRVDDNSADPIGYQVKNGDLWLTDVSYWGTIAEGTAIAGVLGTGTITDYEIVTPCCTGVQVYRYSGSITQMDVCCPRWDDACKPPTGRFAMDAFYVSADKAYAVALWGDEPYEEGAWSVSFALSPDYDLGDAWNQLSLIDTNIDYLSDVAVSPDCNKMMLVSVNLGTEDLVPFEQSIVPFGQIMLDAQQYEPCGCDSVWLKADTLSEAEEYSGKWIRTWCGHLEGDNSDDHFWGSYPERGLLRLPPASVEKTGDTVYLVDRMTDTIYLLTYETLGCWSQISAPPLEISDIVDVAVSGNDTLYALDKSGYVAMYNADEDWQDAVDSKVDSGWTIDVHSSSNNVTATDVLVGGAYGKVSYSSDEGQTFDLLEETPKAFDGLVTVAFDPYFDTNDVIYAALAECEGNGIYRWVIDTSTEWKDLGAKPFDYTGLVLGFQGGNPFSDASKGGVLYASYIGMFHPYWFIDPFDCFTSGEEWMTGVARCLTPAADISCEKCVEWDYLTVGLPHEGSDEAFFRMVPDALKACGCTEFDTNTELFAIGKVDTGYDMCKAEDFTVWTFEDCFAKQAPALVAPVENVTVPADCWCNNLPFPLKWTGVCDACVYDIQIALDPDFTSTVYLGEASPYYEEGGNDYTYAEKGLSFMVPDYLTCQVTYYWRVRAHQADTCQVIHSWWSDTGAITVAPSVDQGTITLTAPTGDDVAVKNVGFTWTLQATATKFDWVLSTNADLSGTPVESKTGLTHTAYTCTKTLSYDTTYYWQVIAWNGNTKVSTSAVGTFRTMVQPTTPTTTTPTTPAWVWVVIAIGAVLVIVVIVLIFRTRRV